MGIGDQPRLIILNHPLPLRFGDRHRFIRAVIVADANRFPGGANLLSVGCDLHQYMRYVKTAVANAGGAHITGYLIGQCQRLQVIDLRAAENDAILIPVPFDNVAPVVGAGDLEIGKVHRVIYMPVGIHIRKADGYRRFVFVVGSIFSHKCQKVTKK